MSIWTEVSVDRLIGLEVGAKNESRRRLMLGTLLAMPRANTSLRPLISPSIEHSIAGTVIDRWMDRDRISIQKTPFDQYDGVWGGPHRGDWSASIIQSMGIPLRPPFALALHRPNPTSIYTRGSHLRGQFLQNGLVYTTVDRPMCPNRSKEWPKSSPDGPRTRSYSDAVVARRSSNGREAGKPDGDGVRGPMGADDSNHLQPIRIIWI